MQPSPSLEELYARLRSHFGFLNWWPGETKTEIIAGAVLTQNTAWRNVEKAIKNLKEKKLLSLEALASASTAEIEKAIKPSGFYRQKAERLKGLFKYIKENYGSLNKFFSKGKDELRNELLSLKGIGRETADSIILYAAEKPTFVIDTYTRRVMHRVYMLDENMDYDKLKAYFEERLDRDLNLYKDFHAQFVELAKRHCRKKPECAACPLNDVCRYAAKKIKKEKSNGKV
ncbi:MAG: endonuclease III domain-containing protein [Candidatus Micrarchaeia archaeon]